MPAATNVGHHMQCRPLFVSDFNKNWTGATNLIKIYDIKFYKNRLSGYRSELYLQTD
jgi:hypothetical protein